MESGSKGLIVGILALALIGGGVVAYKFLNKPPDSNSSSANTPAEGPLPTLPGGKPIEPGTEVQMPFIFWGGDVATFAANGGLETTGDSQFAHQGLKIKLVPGDNFEAQIKDYMADKSPFLRGTLSMLGQASDQLTAKPETMPVVFLQLTWSAGDHLVGRQAFENLNQLKGKKIALQEGGPHVGMLNDILRTARMDWKDITVVWTKDVSGKDGPAAAFRKDNSIDACFAISPEMFALTSAPSTGGIDSVGDGTKDSVKGAHVVVSTQHMARSIADVYACRSDFYKGNRDWIEKFVAGYLHGSEELIDAKTKAGNKDKDAEAKYQKIEKMAQDIWIKDDALKDSVAKLDDVDGLISDAMFVGLPGNESFFTNKGNLSGFQFKQRQACALPVDPSKDPLKTNPKLFQAAEIRYPQVRKIGELRGKPPTRPRIASGAEIKIEPSTEIFRFRVAFKPNEYEFNERDYANDFQRALEVASLFGNTVVAIRGHADPGLLMQRFIQAATRRGLIRRETDTRYTVVADGSTIDFTKDTKKVLEIIKKQPPGSLQYSNLEGDGTIDHAVTQLQGLSDERARNVQKSITSYATSHSLVLDPSQIRTQGVGVSEPENGFPRNDADAAMNRRVEFLVIKVPADKVNTDEFDL
jgi:ABC-type nitrate/sulfonate/bicarbonate transport system substrate-binding protein/outer membrane protein OmpA-like peptidoglycan-associated protein